MMKEIKIFTVCTIICSLLFIGMSVFAAPYYRQEADIVPITNSVHYLGTTTPSTNAWKGIITDQLCLTADICRTTWPSISASFPFTVQSWGVSTTTTIGLLNGFLSTASSTIDSNLIITGNSTTTNATTTNLAVSGNINLTNGHYINGSGGKILFTSSDGNFDFTRSGTANSDFALAIDEGNKLAYFGPVVGNGWQWFFVGGNAGENLLNLSRTALTFQVSGQSLKWSADNTGDIGASGASRPRTGYFGTSVVAPNFLATASSTLQNFTFVNATGTNATTTSLFSTTASSTNLFGQFISGFGLSTCTGSNFLQYSSSIFSCAAAGAGAANSKWATSSVDTLAIYPSDALRVGIGTTTPKWALQIASSTGSQLTLSDPSLATFNHWSFRNAGGILYVASSSPSSFATTSAAMIAINSLTGQLALGTSTFSGGINIDSDTSLNVNSGVTFVDRNANSADTNGVNFDGYRQVTGRNASAGTASITWTTRKLTSGAAYQLNTRTAGGGTILAMTIDNNSGFVGVATTSPYAQLSVAGGTTGTIFGMDTLSGFSGKFLDFKIASSTRFSVNQAGQITTGANNYYITGTTTKSFNIASTTLDAFGKDFRTATSTFLLANFPEAMILRSAYCTASSTGTALLRFGDPTGNYTETATITTGGTTYFATNNTWTANEGFTIQASSTAGTVSRISCTATLNVTSP